MILVRNQNHDLISSDLLRTPGGEGKSALKLTEPSVDKDHLPREVGWFCPIYVELAIEAALAMLLICHFRRVAPRSGLRSKGVGWAVVSHRLAEPGIQTETSAPVSTADQSP
jgi:hypothetical protein